MTALADATSLRRFDDVFALIDRLRTEGTEHLVHAAQVTGARRPVAQSLAGWNHERTGRAVKTEDDPFDPSPPRSMPLAGGDGPPRGDRPGRGRRPVHLTPSTLRR